jgi:hypothetical protein
MVILDEGDLSDQNMALPLNLPMQQKRLPGQPVINIGAEGGTEFVFEYKILIGRISDIYQGDPFYSERFEVHLRDLYLEAQERGENVTSIAEFGTVPNLEAISSSLYQIADPLASIEYQPIWWTVTEPAGTYIHLYAYMLICLYAYKPKHL